MGGALGWLSVPPVAVLLPDDPPVALVVGGVVVAVALFVTREVASGALREAGKDLWEWAKRRVAR